MCSFAKKKNGLKWKIRRAADFMFMHADFILNGHILNPFWHSRDVRRSRRSAAMGQSVRKNLHVYSSDIKKMTAEPVSTVAEPERAFSIWLQGEDQAPDIVKACFRNMRRNLEQELVVIDKSTLFDWIELPEYIIDKWKEGKIGNAHFSDICRVELLYRHGGIWLDATDYLTAPIPQYIMDSEFFVFMAGSKINGWFSFIQNCFIRAHKGNPLLGLWREAIMNYWANEDGAVNYYVHQILFNLTVDQNPQAAALFSKMPKVEQDPTHVLWYGHKDDVYDEARYAELCDNAFFHKTTYKWDKDYKPLPGTIGAYMIKSGI